MSSKLCVSSRTIIDNDQVFQILVKKNQTKCFMKDSLKLVSFTTEQGNSFSSGGYPTISSSGNIPQLQQQRVTVASEEAESLVTKEDENVSLRLRKVLINVRY